MIFSRRKENRRNESRRNETNPTHLHAYSLVPREISLGMSLSGCELKKKMWELIIENVTRFSISLLPHGCDRIKGDTT